MTLDDLRSRWTKIAGPLVAAVSTPAMITGDGTLIVQVGTGLWLADLQRRDAALLNAITTTVGGVAGVRVRRIRWRSGEWGVSPAETVRRRAGRR